VISPELTGPVENLSVILPALRPGRGHDALVAGVVLEDADLTKTGVLRSDRATQLSLVKGDLQKNLPAAAQAQVRPRKDSPVHRQPIEAAVQRLQRFVFADASIKLVNLRRRDVRRIGDDQIKGLLRAASRDR
jgi:hypothetical protein